jgi:hypothetical protein
MTSGSGRQIRALGGISGADSRAGLHLVRDGAEASLCGIPRTSLGAAGYGVDVVCGDCVEWLSRTARVLGPDAESRDELTA